MENSKIEWCDHTDNLWHGCSKVHTGCKKCYAEKQSKRFNPGLWGKNAKRKRIKSAFSDLNKFQRQAKFAETSKTVFVGSMMDIFEPSKCLTNPTKEFENTGQLRVELFIKISQKLYPNLIFLLLTKRPKNIKKLILAKWNPKNVWFGTSISIGEHANQLIDDLWKNSPATSKRFLSIEPQIDNISEINLDHIDWVIQGGESGSGRRPFNVEWARSMRDQCKKKGVPYFFKQIDKIQPIPKDLMIKEFPNFKQ